MDILEEMVPRLEHFTRATPRYLQNQFKYAFDLAVDFVGRDAGLLGCGHPLICQVAGSDRISPAPQ
ncbi:MULTISPECIES: hypothetical protein [unclassified Mesorhizobium]|uniref:hypothetical protein n=1 Tax=unclassified Mesorhizobium TaxID=325217 RepID=UPI000409C6F4|nr:MULTISPECIES: hypothetical protein [unclassified Mesorhizobium]